MSLEVYRRGSTTLRQSFKVHRQELPQAVPPDSASSQAPPSPGLVSVSSPPPTYTLSFSPLSQIDNNAVIAMSFFLFSGLFVVLALAQFPSQTNRNLTTITSPIDGNITISYKSPPLGTCRSAYDWQRQVTGWVNIPGEYPTNTFFWFVEAREPSDQLTIWLNGGPGSSSMIGMFQEVGPCEVIATAEGVFNTTYREWGWDRASHMLYIDQVWFSWLRLPA